MAASEAVVKQLLATLVSFSRSKVKLALVALTVWVSLQHKRLENGRFQHNDLTHLMHTNLYLIRKTVHTLFKSLTGQREHHYWSIADEIVIRTLAYAARIGHCTAPRKAIQGYELLQRFGSKVLGHCHVSDIDLGLGRGVEDAVYISLDKSHILGSVPIVLFLHGGGHCMGTSGMYINAKYIWLEHMLRKHKTPCAVLSINYPLAPEVKYPENLHFAFRAYEAVVARGICPSKIVVAGDSAGGSVAVQVAKHAADFRKANDNAHPPLAGLILISPWVSHSTDADSHEEHLNTDFVAGAEVLRDYSIAYAPEEHHDRLRNPRISPLHEQNFDFLPPTMVTVGSREVFSDDIYSFVDKLDSHNKAVKLSIGQDCPHIHPLLWPLVKDKSQAALEEMGDFVAERFGARTLSPCLWSEKLASVY